MYNDYGYLTIRTYTADGALPISDANVEVQSRDSGMERLSFFTTTDIDGISETIKLPAPRQSYSLKPGPKERPYSTYDIKVSKDGYYTKKIVNVAIFAGINADLPINMIAFSEGSDYPKGNINAIISENEALEG